jgi:hypothetical protein
MKSMLVKNNEGIAERQHGTQLSAKRARPRSRGGLDLTLRIHKSLITRFMMWKQAINRQKVSESDRHRKCQVTIVELEAVAAF